MSQSSTQPFVLDTTPGVGLAALDTVRNAVELANPVFANVKFTNLETHHAHWFGAYVLLDFSVFAAQSDMDLLTPNSLVSSTPNMTLSPIRTHFIDQLQIQVVDALSSWTTAGTSYLPPIDRRDLEILQIEAVYSFRKRHAVFAYLQENPFLINLLIEAAIKVKEYFGFHSQLNLDLFSDAEDSNGSELFVRIGVDLLPAIARQILERLDEEWWLEASIRADCKMNIALEYS